MERACPFRIFPGDLTQFIQCHIVALNDERIGTPELGGFPTDVHYPEVPPASLGYVTVVLWSFLAGAWVTLDSDEGCGVLRIPSDRKSGMEPMPLKRNACERKIPEVPQF